MPDTANLQKNSSLKDIRLYLLLSLALIIVIMLISIFWLSPQIQPTKLHFREDPLKKQPHTLAPGDYYRYSYTSNVSEGLNYTFTYVLVGYNNCTGIYIQESSNRTPSCIDHWGNDKAGNNLSLDNPFIYFFKPWMLAVNDSWTWKVTAYFSFPTEQFNFSEVYLYTLEKEDIYGRDAYKVIALLSTSDGEEEQILYWVDVEKRILLLEKGSNYEIRLVSSSLSNN